MVREMFLSLLLLLLLIHWASQVALMVKNPPVNAGNIRDVGLIPGLGRSPGGGHSNPLQYSCPENPMNREAWWATVHRVAKSQIRLKQLSMHAHTINTLIIISCLRYIPSNLQETKVGTALICYDQKQEITREIEVVYSLYLNKKCLHIVRSIVMWGSHLLFCSAIFVFYIYRPSLYHTAMEVLVTMYAVNTRKVKKNIQKLSASMSQFEELNLTK